MESSRRLSHQVPPLASPSQVHLHFLVLLQRVHDGMFTRGGTSFTRVERTFVIIASKMTHVPTIFVIVVGSFLKFCPATAFRDRAHTFSRSHVPLAESLWLGS